MKSFKRVLSFLIAVVMLLGLAACGNDTPETTEPKETTPVSGGDSTTPADTTPVEDDKISFPLKEEVTFDIMVKYDGDANEAAKNVPFFQALYEATNVKINFISLPSDTVMNNINALFTAGQEGDAIMNNIIGDADLMAMVDSGLIIPLDEYVDNAELMPNLNNRVFGESPESKGYITSADGHIYSLPRYNALNGDYLESPLWINKLWLENVGMDVPTSIAELEAVLVAFRDQDANGNGDPNDEIPLLFYNAHSLSHMEALLGMWGLATKDNGSDYFVDIDDGKVVYVPTSEGYKDAIKTLNSWYEQGLIWSEAFTGTGETFVALTNGDGETAKVGIWTTKNVSQALLDQYVQVEPFAAEGYDVEWFLHPGRLATKSKFCVTRSCENPEILMAWIDLFYDFQNSVHLFYGEENVGWEYVDADSIMGPIVYADEAKNEEAMKQRPISVFGDCPGAFTAAEYASEALVLSDIVAVKNTSYEIYKPYFDDEFWPRPYMDADDAARLNELRTDINNTVAMYKANWVMGVSDIDAEWDDYVKAIEKMGIGEYIEIIQRAYDQFVENSK